MTPLPAGDYNRPMPRVRARISAIARDGSRAAEFPLTRDATQAGRAVDQGHILLDRDPFIAPLHAIFRFERDQLVVQDAGSANGVFLWLQMRKLASGDELRVGRQRLRVERMPPPRPAAREPVWGSPDPGYAARVVQLFEGGGEGEVFPLREGENLIGRSSGDVQFPQDGYVSSRHATLTVTPAEITVRDLGSANGTFSRVAASAPLSDGDLLLIGEQILRVDPA